MTTFIVAPLEAGQHTQVTFSTELKQRSGILGRVERFFTTMFLRRTYAQELDLLAVLAEERSHFPVAA